MRAKVRLTQIYLPFLFTSLIFHCLSALYTFFSWLIDHGFSLSLPVSYSYRRVGSYITFATINICQNAMHSADHEEMSV